MSLTPAQMLVGVELPNGWRATKRVEKKAYATGGNFSEGYIVESPNHGIAFLKALDYSLALSSNDPAKALHAMTAAFEYERAVCFRCRDRKLDRVVRTIEDGSVMVLPGRIDSVVQYLIFELADKDVRNHLDELTSFDTAWALRTLHQIATGLTQLHSNGIAHQDLKPSNVLLFDRSESKLADLGRSACRDESAPHDGSFCAGDRTYAPPELLYRHIDPDWNVRRQGCDVFLLGSMIVFFFARAGITGLLMSRLPTQMHWRNWNGSFRDVVPYLRDAFDNLMVEFERAIPEEIRDDIVQIVRQLCDPDPMLRGDPARRAQGQNQYALERYVSHLDRLSRKAEQNILRRN